MTLFVARLTKEETELLRLRDAERCVAESGHPGQTPSEARQVIVAYYELLAALHERYELDDEDEVYQFDCARGFILSGLD